MVLGVTVIDEDLPYQEQGTRHVSFGPRPAQRIACRRSGQLFCQTVQRGGSLFVVMTNKVNWARMIVAVFTIAMFYASVCSTICAVGVCPDQVQQTAGHDCDQMPSHHPHQSNHQSPDTPDCSQHQHPGLFVTKSGDVSQFQLSVLNHLTAAATTFSVAQSLPAFVSYSDDSEHALPLVSSVPLYQQISVLRI